MLRSIIGLTFALLWGGGALRAEEAVFRVTRDGAGIGAYRFATEAQEGRRAVVVEMAIKVRVLFIPVYQATHHREEIWEGDRLVSIEGTSTYNGVRYDLKFWRSGERGHLRVNEATEEITDPVITLVPWRPAISGPATLLAEKGKAEAVTVSFERRETITVAGRPVEAEKYRLAGRKEREAWYDAEGRLLQVRYETRGSVIKIEREPPAAKL